MTLFVKLNDYVTKTAGCRYVPNTGSIEKDIKATQAALFTHGPLAVALDANKLSFRDAVVQNNKLYGPRVYGSNRIHLEKGFINRGYITKKNVQMQNYLMLLPSLATV